MCSPLISAAPNVAGARAPRHVYLHPLLPLPAPADGGHDSRFHSNVVVAASGQNCVGTASFVPGHATQIFDNDCIVVGTERVDDLFENCNPPSAGQENIVGFNNRFYTQHANASATCDCCGERPLAMLPKGLEDNFTSSFLPSAATIIAMGRAKLDLPA